MTIRVAVPVPTATPSASASTARTVQFGIEPSEHAIGLIANGKHLADHLLVMTATELRRRGFGGEHVLMDKPSSARAATTEARSELLARARIILTGVGD